MKRVSILVLVVVALVVALASCATTPAHTHTYGTEFKYNETQHWIGATCTEAGCADVKIAAANHFDKNEDGFCDACAYDLGHEHTYATAWESDDTHHWHAANCGCADVAPADKAEHDVNDLGVCEVCDKLVAAPDVTTVEKAIAVGASQRGQVVSGSVQQTSDYSGSYTLYTYAPDYTLYIGAGSELWLSKSGDEYVGVQVAYGEVSKYDYEDVEQLMTEGYLYDGQFIGYYDTFYGAENLVKGLYEIASIDDAAANLVANVSDGVYSFTFDLCGYEEVHDDDGTLLGTVVNSITKVSVTFTLADTYYIDNVEITSAYYTAVETVEGKASIIADAEADSNYAITVVQDTALWDNIYTAERMEFASFDLIDQHDQPIAEKITVELGSEALYVYFTNVLPITANMAIDIPEVTVDGGAFGHFVNTQDGYVMLFTNQVTEPGTHTVTFTTANVTKTFEIEFVRPELEYIYVTGEIPMTDWSGEVYYVLGEIESVDAFAGDNITFRISANSTYCDRTVTVAVTDANGNTVEVVLGTVTKTVVIEENYSSYEEDLEFLTFVLVDAGTYTVTVTSTVDSSLSDTFTVNVAAAPSVEDMLNAKVYEAKDAGLTYTFALNDDAATEGVLEGTLAISDGINIDNYTYAYDVATRQFALTLVGDAATVIYYVSGYYESDIFELSINSNYEIAAYYAYSAYLSWGVEENVILTEYVETVPSIMDANGMGGVYQAGMDMGGSIYVLYEIEFIVAEAGAFEGTLVVTDYNNYKYSGTYYYTIDSDYAYVITDASGNVTTDIILGFTWEGTTFQCPDVRNPLVLTQE